MQRALLADMRCPYCAGAFRVVDGAVFDASGERIEWGLLACRCFEFPIVDGVLLLSLAKGYGGPEDAQNPYVPLQVAAITHLRGGDVVGLRAWIARHAPHVHGLLSEAPDEPYLDVSARLGDEITPLVVDYLDAVARYEVIGQSAPKKRRRAPKPSPAAAESRLGDFYVIRFFSPRGNALALRLAHLPLQGRVLSLACGHGVFENFVRALGAAPQMVCVDAQLVNLLITRRYSGGDNFIVHDVQFPLPFLGGTFDGVFSSSCLPEIPSQMIFAAESMRVTNDTGWTFFDRIWNLEIGVRRVDRLRHYRFAQNFFTSLADYVAMFRELSARRTVAVDIPQPAHAYVDAPGWTFGDDAVDAVVAARTQPELSALVVDPDKFAGFVAPKWDEIMRAEALSPSPLYEASTDGTRLSRRNLDLDPGSLAVAGSEAALDDDVTLDPSRLLHHFAAAHLAFLPRHFDRTG